MAGDIKPVTPLTDAQAKSYSDLDQQATGIRKVMADAQTNWSASMQDYQALLDKFNAENYPNLARDNYNNIIAKCQNELARIEEAKRDIRVIELASAVDYLSTK